MAYSDADLQEAFAAEAGDVSNVATAAMIRLWYNEAQARLLRFLAAGDAIEWDAGNTQVDLPADFIQLDRIVCDLNVRAEPWVVFGRQLIIRDPNGACADGSATLYYWADWPKITDSDDSVQSSIGDIACLYYALHRFYRLLASNRAYYKRYATLVGANAVTVNELQAEADRYYQDFIDTRADLEPLPAAAFYGG